MGNDYLGRLSPTMPDMDLNTLIKVKKENGSNMDFRNHLDFEDGRKNEDKESQLLQFIQSQMFYLDDRCKYMHIDTLE